MTVAKELKDKWQSLYTYGDISAIQRSMPKKIRVTDENIRVCVKMGEFANLNVFEAVVKFYKAKEKMINELIQ